MHAVSRIRSTQQRLIQLSGLVLVACIACEAPAYAVVRVVGSVIDASQGTGLHFARVSIRAPGADGGEMTTTTAADGSFEIGLPPGSGAQVFVSARSSGFLPFGEWLTTAAVVGAPLRIELHPAPPRTDLTLSGVVYDGLLGAEVGLEGVLVELTYHNPAGAYEEATVRARTGRDGRYSFDLSLGAGDWIELHAIARGFADAHSALGLANLGDGAPWNIAMARFGGVLSIEPASVRMTCSGTFPVTMTNTAAAEDVVILALGMGYHYGSGVYGQAFSADFRGVTWPLTLAPGESLTFPMTFTAGAPFPTLANVEVESGAREEGTTQYYGGFEPCISHCTGDCDGGGDVTIEEVVQGVQILLGERELSACANLDRDDDSAVSVDELVAAIGDAVEGCDERE